LQFRKKVKICEKLRKISHIKKTLALSHVADPHHLDADPDPAFHFDADPDSDPDPVPSFQMKAQSLEKLLK